RRFERDVLVVAGFCLGGGREDRLGEGVALAEARRQADAADRLRRLVFLPAAAREVAPGHAFDRDDPGLSTDHCAPAQLGKDGFKARRHGITDDFDEVVRVYTIESFEPEL